MVAIGKEEGPTMGHLFVSADIVRGRSSLRAVHVHPPYFTPRVRSIEKDSLAPPAAATRGENLGQHLRSSAGSRDFLQFSVGKKRHRGPVRRPEWIACTLRSLEDCHFGRPDALCVEHRQS